MTFEEAIEHVREIVRRTGWAVQMVAPPPRGVGWAYTVGLDRSYSHPELVVLDEDVRRGGDLLNALAQSVRDGTVFKVGETICLGEHHAELIDVHPVHARGNLLAQWHNVERFDGGARTFPEALQVIVPDFVEASGQRAMRTRLDLPYARVPT